MDDASWKGLGDRGLSGSGRSRDGEAKRRDGGAEGKGGGAGVEREAMWGSAVVGGARGVRAERSGILASIGVKTEVERGSVVHSSAAEKRRKWSEAGQRESLLGIAHICGARQRDQRTGTISPEERRRLFHLFKSWQAMNFSVGAIFNGRWGRAGQLPWGKVDRKSLKICPLPLNFECDCPGAIAPTTVCHLHPGSGWIPDSS
jgi:hypothetical protein